MRALVILFFAVIVIALVWRTTGHPLPLFDYQIGGFGNWAPRRSGSPHPGTTFRFRSSGMSDVGTAVP